MVTGAMKCLILLSVFPLHVLSEFQPVRAAHPEDTYGPTLACEKDDGIGPCQAVEVAGNRLYATGRGRFHVLDISIPSKPVSLGELTGLGNTRQLVVKDTIAYF